MRGGVRGVFAPGFNKEEEIGAKTGTHQRKGEMAML
jgi:hypothetical protein